ncbi:MAG: carboxymuconolactone decarboxylase family protein [Bacillota bacterium]|nr:carboxymuconolactone decarboxylase family protein [Bacillota bacterium]
MQIKQVLTAREKELIAIAASIAGKCASCLLYHFSAAREAGAGLDEIREAIAIGEAIQAEPVNQLRQLSQQLLGDAAEAPIRLERNATAKSC